MAAYTVTDNERGVHAKTLVAATVDTVTIQRGCESVEVLSEDGASPITFTVDGTTPTVAGNTGYYLPATGAVVVDVPGPGGGSANTVVKLISAGTPKYGVTGL